MRASRTLQLARALVLLLHAHTPEAKRFPKGFRPTRTGDKDICALASEELCGVFKWPSLGPRGKVSAVSAYPHL